MSKQKNNNSIAELGEFGLIDFLVKDFKTVQRSTIKAVGDDAAVIDGGSDYVLVTTDMLVEGIHFDLIYTPMKHLGYKSVVVNLSDIYAMNGNPQQITVSLAVSAKFGIKALEELYEGIRLACEAYNVDLVGGDTTTSLTGLCLSITALGRVSKDKICNRSGAKLNDLICVSGNLGASYLGLQLLEREKQIFLSDNTIQPEISRHPYCIQRFLKPEARRDIVESLANASVLPTAMIDISDGLSSDILHICKQSQVSCVIYEDKLPVDAEAFALAQEFGIDVSIAALNGGEDYELLFTVDQKHYEQVLGMAGVSVIGYISEGKQGGMLKARNGVEVPLEAQGWNHMRDS